MGIAINQRSLDGRTGYFFWRWVFYVFFGSTSSWADGEFWHSSFWNMGISRKIGDASLQKCRILDRVSVRILMSVSNTTGNPKLFRLPHAGEKAMDDQPHIEKKRLRCWHRIYRTWIEPSEETWGNSLSIHQDFCWIFLNASAEPDKTLGSSHSNPSSPCLGDIHVLRPQKNVALSVRNSSSSMSSQVGSLSVFSGRKNWKRNLVVKHVNVQTGSFFFSARSIFPNCSWSLLGGAPLINGL